jgi:prevent-host-death family protein
MRIDTQEFVMAARERKYSTVSATEVQRHFRDVLRRLQEEGGPLVIERDGVPAAALVPMEELEQLQKMLAAENLQRLDELRKSLQAAAADQGLTEEMLLEQMRETRRTLYEERYGKKSS